MFLRFFSSIFFSFSLLFLLEIERAASVGEEQKKRERERERREEKILNRLTHNAKPDARLNPTTPGIMT